MKPGDVVKVKSWCFPKAKKAVVITTYKDGDVRVLPETSEYFQRVQDAVKANDIDSIRDLRPAINAQTAVLSTSEFSAVDA